jgi:tetratricopeptide (TPR) repeat protein
MKLIMKVKDIFSDTSTKIFKVTNSEDENELLWTIKPTNLELIPYDTEFYFVKAIQTLPNSTIDCFINITTPERIADFVVKLNSNGQTIIENYYEQENSVIPTIASDCFGDYELYYSKENPQIGIDILKSGLTKATNKNIVAEDLGYILRDEGRIEEAIEAFKISEEYEPSSEYTYWELSGLYEQLGQVDKQIEYIQKYKDNGGIDQ